MAVSLNESALTALTATLKEKVARLLAAQTELAEQRAALLGQQRRNDRDLADCRATARLFELDIDIPTPDRDSLASERELFEMSQRALAETQMARRQFEVDELRQRAFLRDRNRLVHAASTPLIDAGRPAPVPEATASIPRAIAPTKRPSLREFVTERLREAGSNGAKAAPLRELFERAYGQPIHEKTVGMTLYRMSNDGLVRREGHVWFLAEPSKDGEAGNPGAETPGPNQLL